MGDKVEMVGGSGNFGIVKGKATVIQNVGNPADATRAVRDLRSAIDSMRSHLDADDGKELDEALVDLDVHAEPKAFRKALGRIAGVAILVGKIGAPVITAVEAVRAVMGN
jgi:hypothetical protein